MSKFEEVKELIWHAGCEDCNFLEACDKYEEKAEETLCDLMYNKLNGDRR